jgi:hypothetical protein
VSNFVLGSEARHHGYCFLVSPIHPQHHHMIIGTIGTLSIVGFRGARDQQQPRRALEFPPLNPPTAAGLSTHKAKKRRAREATNEPTSHLSSLLDAVHYCMAALFPPLLIIGELMTPTCVEPAGR